MPSEVSLPTLEKLVADNERSESDSAILGLLLLPLKNQSCNYILASPLIFAKLLNLVKYIQLACNFSATNRRHIGDISPKTSEFSEFSSVNSFQRHISSLLDAGRQLNEQSDFRSISLSHIDPEFCVPISLTPLGLAFRLLGNGHLPIAAKLLSKLFNISIADPKIGDNLFMTPLPASLVKEGVSANSIRLITKILKDFENCDGDSNKICREIVILQEFAKSGVRQFL